MKNIGNFDLALYVTLRKLMADIAWYRKHEKIDLLSSQIAEHSSIEVFLHNNSEKTISGIVRAIRKIGVAELEGLQEGFKHEPGMSDHLTDYLKTWSDMCFYIHRPKAYEMLLGSTFDDRTVIRCGMLEFCSAEVPDDEVMIGDVIRRMLCYPTRKIVLDGAEYIDYNLSTYNNFKEVTDALRSGEPIDADSAMGIHDMLIKEAEALIWETDKYYYFTGYGYGFEKFEFEADGTIVLKERPEKECLASLMSDLTYYPLMTWDEKFKHEFRRKVFDAVMEKGIIPEEVFLERTEGRVAVEEYVKCYGPSELFPVLDGAFFMYAHKDEQEHFRILQKVCDWMALDA